MGSSSGSDIIFEIDYNSGEHTAAKIGDVKYTPSTGEMAFQFTDEAAGWGVGAMWFELDASLNLQQIGDDQQTEVKLEIGKTTNTYHLTVGDNDPTDPKIAKTASGVTNGVITWSLTVTNGTHPVNGFTLTDTLSRGHEYVAGSMRMDDTKTGDPTVSGNGTSGQILTKTFDLAGGSTRTNPVKTVITYQTKITTAAYATGSGGMKEGNISVSNGVEATWTGQPEPHPTANHTVTDTIKKWLSKSGHVANATTGEVNWTVVVSTNGVAFQDLTMYDDFNDEWFEYVSGTFRVNGAAPAGTLSTTGASDHDISDVIPASETSAGTATITYTTKVKASKLAAYIASIPTGDALKNSVWLTYEWPDGLYPGTHTSPSVGILPGLGDAYVKKSSSSYDTKNQTITWKVIVNESKQVLSNVVLTDTLPEGNDYVVGSVNIIGRSDAANDAAVSVTEDMSGTAPKFKLSDTIHGSVTIEFQTKLKESEKAVYAGNASKNYTNRVDMSAIATINANSQTVSGSSSANTNYSSTVLEKSTASYDYAAKQIEWTLVLNKNQMDMAGVSIEDILPEGTSLVSGSVTVQTGTGARQDLADDMLTPGYSVTGQTLTVRVGNLAKDSGSTTIQYKTLLDIDGDALKDGFSGKKATTALKNEATLKNDYGVNPQIAATNTITNRLLSKEVSGADTSPFNVLHYTVNVNANGAMIPMMGDRTVLFDVLGSGLLLKINTVRLYRGIIQPNGSLTRGSEVTFAGTASDTAYTFTTSKNEAGRTVLQVTLPLKGIAYPATQAYILQYDTTITDYHATSFTNSIAMNSVMSGPESEKKVNLAQTLSSRRGGGGSLGSNAVEITLKLTKKDSATGGLLSGAQFSLHEKYNGMEYFVGTATTDIKGEAVFTVSNKGVDYIIREIQPPVGYTGTFEVTQNVPLTADNHASYTFTALNTAHTTGTPTPSITPTVTPSITPTVTPSITPTAPPNITPTEPPNATPTAAPSVTPIPVQNHQEPDSSKSEPPTPAIVVGKDPVQYSPEAIAAWEKVQKEYQKSSEAAAGKKLPKTGGLTGSVLLFLLGGGLVGCGIYISHGTSKARDDMKVQTVKKKKRSGMERKKNGTKEHEETK